MPSLISPDQPLPPKITTIIAALNAGATIARAIRSFKRQSYLHKELIVIDGGSTDDTLSILRRHSSTIAFWSSQPDDGIYNAWNQGIRWASGDWLHFLGADDWYHDDEVFRRAGGHLPHASALVVYGSVVVVDAYGRPLRRIGAPWQARNFRTLGMTLCHQSVFHARRLFEQFGGFAAAYGPALDYEFLLRYLKDHDATFVSNLNVAYIGNGGISHDPRHQRFILTQYRKAQIFHNTIQFRPAFAFGYAKAWLKGALATHLRVHLSQRSRRGPAPGG